MVLMLTLPPIRGMSSMTTSSVITLLATKLSMDYFLVGQDSGHTGTTHTGWASAYMPGLRVGQLWQFIHSPDIIN